MNRQIYHLLLCILIIFLNNSYSFGQKEVKVGAFNYYPAIFKDKDGTIKGFYVDALTEIGSKENIHFVYEYGTWNDGLQKVKNGEIDLMPSMAYSVERSKFLDYMETSLLTVWGEVYVSENSKIDGILNLAGKKIAIMKGDMNANHLIELCQKLSITCEFVEKQNFEEVFLSISKGNVDAGVVNNTYGAAKYMDFQVRTSGIVFNPFEIYFATKKGTNADLLKTINKYLEQWKYDEKSVYNVAREKWSHGDVGKIKVIPRWLKNSLYITGLVLLFLLAFIILLRYQVRKAVKGIQNSEKKFSVFMQNTPAFVYIKDSSLKHIYSNKMVEAAVKSHDNNGLSSAKSIFNEEITNMLETADRKILCGEVESLNLIYSGIVNNKEIWLHDYKFAILLNDDEIAVGGIAFDITELKQTQLQLQASKEKAEQNDRLKTAFLQNLSHEIRTPLNAVCGFSGLLERDNLNPEKRKEFSQIIKKSSSQLLNMVTDLLTISSLETGQEELNVSNFDVNKLMEELLTVFESQANIKGLQMDWITSQDRPLIELNSDKGKIYRILHVLLSNAIKFTSKGHIQFGYILKSAHGEEKSFTNASEIQFFVKDTGIGIKPEHFETIFNHFHQADETIQVNFGGAGLGLSIARGFAKLLNGSIRVESEFNTGSVFYLSIPLLAKGQSILADQKTIGVQRLKSVLVAEDEEYNFLYLAELLSELNIDVIHAWNGSEAVDLFVQNQHIDLILMDIKMPVMDGKSAAQEIKKRKPEIPIIAQSAYALSHEAGKYNGIFDGFLAKPIDAQQFGLTIKQFIKS